MTRAGALLAWALAAALLAGLAAASGSPTPAAGTQDGPEPAQVRGRGAEAARPAAAAAARLEWWKGTTPGTSTPLDAAQPGPFNLALCPLIPQGMASPLPPAPSPAPEAAGTTSTQLPPSDAPGVGNVTAASDALPVLLAPPATLSPTPLAPPTTSDPDPEPPGMPTWLSIALATAGGAYFACCVVGRTVRLLLYGPYEPCWKNAPTEAHVLYWLYRLVDLVLVQSAYWLLWRGLLECLLWHGLCCILLGWLLWAAFCAACGLWWLVANAVSCVASVFLSPCRCWRRRAARKLEQRGAELAAEIEAELAAQMEAGQLHGAIAG